MLENLLQYTCMHWSFQSFAQALYQTTALALTALALTALALKSTLNAMLTQALRSCCDV